MVSKFQFFARITSMERLEFNVPTSLADRTTVAANVEDQYSIITSSVEGVDGGIVNDWTIFEVVANTQTGLMPAQAQGGSFSIVNDLTPENIRITGYGVDHGSDNQTQQTHSGALVSDIISSRTSATLEYRADSRGGNSEGPVIVEGNNNTAIGIHSHAGCNVSGGENHGTSFKHAELWNLLQR